MQTLTRLEGILSLGLIPRKGHLSGKTAPDITKNPPNSRIGQAVGNFKAATNDWNGIKCIFFCGQQKGVHTIY